MVEIEQKITAAKDADPKQGAENIEKNQPSVGAEHGNKAAAAQETPRYEDPHLQELHENRFKKKGARAAFHLVNFGGLHQIFNNVASVVITYYMTTTNLADKMKKGMGDSAIGKGLNAVLSLPAKATNGIFKLVGVDLNKELNALPELEKNAEIVFRKSEANRNAIETLFMCAAGFMALFPVWYLENHREGFLNKVDSWLHPGRSKEEKEASSLKPGDEPKETWWNLIRARIIALGVVFGIDQARANIDSILKYKHNALKKTGQATGMYKNVDSVFGWGLGDKLYNKMSPGVRGWLARFFSGNLKGEKLLLSGIQDETRADVMEITKAPDFVRKAGEEIAVIKKQIKLTPHNEETLKAQIKTIEERVKSSKTGLNAVERAVFAEQSRLFLTKEVFLTTILSVVIYTCTKWSVAHHILDKIGLKKKKTHEGQNEELVLPDGVPIPVDGLAHKNVAENKKTKWVEQVRTTQPEKPKAHESYKHVVEETQNMGTVSI